MAKFIDEIKALYHDGKKLPLIEDFYTLQGEGFHMGRAAYFIRIGGCDIGCYWCDSKYSWRPDRDQLVDIETLVEKASSYPAKAIVVTGGEPLNYNLDPLCNLMKNNGITTYLETTGAYELSGQWDWICLSPKPNQPPKEEIIPLADELKVIIYEDSDFEFAEHYANKVKPGTHLFLQPEWSRHKENTPKIVEYIKENPKWRISIQAHKFMKIP